MRDDRVWTSRRARAGLDTVRCAIDRSIATGLVLGSIAIVVGAGCDATGEDRADTGGFKLLVEIEDEVESEKGTTPELPAASLWQAPLDDPELEAGRRVWTGTCIDCHSTGLGGAPLIGNETLWGPRLAKGLDVLFEHALQGFYGDVGEMPARGGNAELTDDEVRAAVRFMTSRVGVGT